MFCQKLATHFERFTWFLFNFANKTLSQYDTWTRRKSSFVFFPSAFFSALAISVRAGKIVSHHYLDVNLSSPLFVSLDETTTGWETSSSVSRPTRENRKQRKKKSETTSSFKPTLIVDKSARRLKANLLPASINNLKLWWRGENNLNKNIPKSVIIKISQIIYCKSIFRPAILLSQFFLRSVTSAALRLSPVRMFVQHCVPSSAVSLAETPAIYPSRCIVVSPTSTVMKLIREIFLPLLDGFSTFFCVSYFCMRFDV